VLGEEHPLTLLTMSNQAVVYQMQGKYEQAEALSTRAFEILRRMQGEENIDTVISMTIQGLLYRSEGKYAQAEPLLIKALDIRRRMLGQEHPNTLTSMKNLANRLCCKNDPVGPTHPTSCIDGSAFQSESFPDELNLPKYIPFRQPPHLAFPDHVQNLVALNRSPRSIEGSKSLAAIYPPLDPSMVLFHNIV
jgi:tetratricopeptide (TPR) repeat protein